LILTTLIAIILANPAVAGKYNHSHQGDDFPRSLRAMVSQFGSIIWISDGSTDSEIATTALNGLGVFAFVRITNYGFAIYDCEEQDLNKPYEPRVCGGYIRVEVNEGEDKAEALYSVLDWMSYSLVAVGTHDPVTLEALRPHARFIEPYNNDEPGRFISKGQFTNVTIILEDHTRSSVNSMEPTAVHQPIPINTIFLTVPGWTQVFTVTTSTTTFAFPTYPDTVKVTIENNQVSIKGWTLDGEVVPCGDQHYILWEGDERDNVMANRVAYYACISGGFVTPIVSGE